MLPSGSTIVTGLAAVLTLALQPAPAAAQDVADSTARVERLGDGVYVIIHKDATPDWPHGNTGVVIGADGVLVVDATYLPSRAVADIALIRRLTNKPVKFLVNTHWHYDHNNGNGAYKTAFPDIVIVSHTETRRIMSANATRYPKAVIAAGSPPRTMLDSARAQLARGTDGAGRALAATARAALVREIGDREREQREMASVVPVLPTATFDSELTLDLGGRDVQLLHWSRANTPGDVAILVPGADVVFTGDLVVFPVPYAYNSIPVEWPRSLRALESLPVRTYVPGHGPVMHDAAYIRLVRELIEYVVPAVAKLEAGGATLVEVRKQLDLESFKRRFVTSDPMTLAVWNDSIVGALVARAFEAARGSL